MQILVIEDEPRLAEAIAQILREKKYMVDIANDGRDGFAFGLEERRHHADSVRQGIYRFRIQTM